MELRVVGRAGLAGAWLLALLAAGCSGGGAASVGGGSAVAPRGLSFGKGLRVVVNASTRRGGTLVFEDVGVPATDPALITQGYMRDFSRLYATPLMTFRSCPGSCGLELVPGTATGPGQVSANGLTWTFHLKRGARFSDGQLVTSQDVKYAVERTFAPRVLPGATPLFRQLLARQSPAYRGPWADRSPGRLGLRSVLTPDPSTIVFRLARPFADFNDVAALPATAPVPPGRDTGARYGRGPVSTGPYMFAGYSRDGFALVPNRLWQTPVDPQAAMLPARIVVRVNVPATQLTDDLISGVAQADLTGAGLSGVPMTTVLNDATLRSEADDTPTGIMDLAYIGTAGPLSDVHCRRAVEFAADRPTLARALGGPYGATVAPSVIPPGIPGSGPAAHALPPGRGTGAARARAELRLCGHPTGFAVTIGYPASDPVQSQAAAVLAAGLGGAGIKAVLKALPGTTPAGYRAAAAYARRHGAGVVLGKLESPWPAALGWLGQVAGDPAGAGLGDRAVSRLIAQMSLPGAQASRYAALAGQASARIMADALVLPEAFAQAVLYRSPGLTNMYVQPAYGTYNYAVLGVSTTHATGG